MVFTNGTLLENDDLERMERLGNLVLYLSLDGLEETNDARRGQGVFRRVEQAAMRLKHSGLPFGIAATVTSVNDREIVSPLFVETTQAWGAMGVLYLRFWNHPQSPDDPGLRLSPAQVAEYEQLLAAAQARQSMPLVDADAAEMNLGGCCARQGELAFVDVVTGQLSPCVKLPFASPCSSLLENAVPGRLAERLQQTDFRNLWRGLPGLLPCQEGQPARDSSEHSRQRTRYRV